MQSHIIITLIIIALVIFQYFLLGNFDIERQLDHERKTR